MRRWIGLVGVVSVLAVGCGDDADTQTSDPPPADDGGDATADDGADGADPADGDHAAGGDEAAAIGCPPQGFDGTVTRTASGDHTDADFTTADVWVDGVVAARLSDGAQYTLYVSDHEYVGDPRDFDTVVADAGGTLASVFVGLQSGYVAGESIADTDEGAFISAIVDSGGGAEASTMGSTGTATPIAWSDDWVCVEIDYQDDQQQVSGTISAPIVSGF